MAQPLSPGVFTIEVDQSTYAPTLNSSVVGIVGFASKGPVAEATLITSPEQLIRTFGKPDASLPGQGLVGAVEILETTNSIYYVRGAGATATQASANVTLGTCPAVVVSAHSFGLQNSLYLAVQVTDSNGVNKFLTPKQFSIPANTLASGLSTNNQAKALLNVIGGSLDRDKVSVEFTSSNGASGNIVGAWAGTNASLYVSAYSDSAFSVGLSCLAALDNTGSPGVFGSSVQALGATLNTTGVNSPVAYFVESLWPGAGYNAGTDSTGATSGNSVSITTLGSSRFLLQVNDSGTRREVYKVNFVSGSSYIENVINTGVTNPISEVIAGFLTAGGSDANPTMLSNFDATVFSLFGTNAKGTYNAGINTVLSGMKYIKAVEGTYSLAGGSNGVSNSDDTNAATLIGDPTVSPKTGIYALDDDTLNISVALTPGVNHQDLQNALITLAEDTQNFIALVAPPYASINTVQEAIEWSNGRSETRTSPINSSYAAIFWPWLQVFNVFVAADQWYDPTIFAARQMCFTDTAAEPWFAPAGFQRGRLTKPTAVEVILNQGDRDSLYSGGNIINPIVNFPTQGITIWGQRTAQRLPSALDRINVRRLMVFLRKSILASTQGFVFEPNDPVTWNQIQSVVDPLLDDIRRRRGLIDYRVICDETTNPPEVIDRNEIQVKVLLKPTKAVEIIEFFLTLTDQGAKLGG